jgi:hypothetical protein
MNQPRQPDQQQTIGIEGHSLWRLAPEHVNILAKDEPDVKRPWVLNRPPARSSGGKNRLFDGLACRYVHALIAISLLGLALNAAFGALHVQLLIGFSEES